MSKFIRFPLIKKETKECYDLKLDMDTLGLREQIFTEEGNSEWVEHIKRERKNYLKEKNIENIVSICHLIKYKRSK